MGYGDIFTYLDRQYVYLAIIDQVLYAALIVGPQQAREVITARAGSVKKDGVLETRAKPMFCFVELQTTGYEQHIASLARTDDDKNPGQVMHGEDDKLCHEDLVEMQQEIVNGNVPGVLKDQIRTIELAERTEQTAPAND